MLTVQEAIDKVYNLNNDRKINQYYNSIGENKMSMYYPNETTCAEKADSKAADVVPEKMEPEYERLVDLAYRAGSAESSNQHLENRAYTQREQIFSLEEKIKSLGSQLDHSNGQINHYAQNFERSEKARRDLQQELWAIKDRAANARDRARKAAKKTTKKAVKKTK